MTLPMILFALYPGFALSSSEAHRSGLNVYAMTPPLVASHRGGVGGISSNTLERFRIALTQRAEIIEMDLRSTKDGVAVVFHDPKLDTDTNCSGPVEDLLFRDLQNCRYSRSGHKIPTFQETLALIKGQKIVDAEFKNEKVIEPALRDLEKFSAHRWVYFQTKDQKDMYETARRLNPSVALLFKARTPEQLDWALQLNDPKLVVIEFDERMMSSENLRKVREAGKLSRANAWRFDSSKEFFTAGCKKLYKWGVSISHTNQPESCFNQKRFYKEP